MTVLEKEEKLKAELKALNSIAIAYSGGVDSSYLADVANECLNDKAIMVIADSPSIPRSELKDAVELANKRAWNLQIIRTEEHLNKDYQKNDGERCYFCKSELFDHMNDFCKENNIPNIAYGAIIDDLSDHRPGAVAAEEFSVKAPLQDAGLSKEEIRILSRERNLPTSEKASFACLASRFPVGEEVSVEKLSQVEMAEEVLKELGLKQYRARHHGDICRIEIDFTDIEIFMEKRTKIETKIKSLGYKFVTLDLGGYRTGSTSSKN